MSKPTTAWRQDMAGLLSEAERRWLLEAADQKANREAADVFFGCAEEPREPEFTDEPVLGPEADAPAVEWPGICVESEQEPTEMPSRTETAPTSEPVDVANLAAKVAPFSLSCARFATKYGVRMEDINEIATCVAAVPLERLRDVAGGIAIIGHLYCREYGRLTDKLDVLALLAAEDTAGRKPVCH